MAPVTSSLADYLSTSYDPNCEFIDGEVLERNAGLTKSKPESNDHAFFTALIAGAFDLSKGDSPHVTLRSRRLQVSPTRVRVPDVTLFITGVLTEAPTLAIEVITSLDTFSDTVRRVADYHQAGVGTVWLIDLTSKTGCYCVGRVWTYGDVLEVAGTDMRFEVHPLFTFFEPETDLR